MAENRLLNRARQEKIPAVTGGSLI